MRLILECFACDPHHSSESFNAWCWTRALAEAGHQIDLITTEVGGVATRNEAARLGLGSVTVHELPRNHRLLRIRFGYYLDYIQWLSRSARLAKNLLPADIAHHISWGNLLLGTRLWKLGVPTVLGPCGGGQTMETSLLRHLEADRGFELARSCAVRSSLAIARLAPTGLVKCHVLASNAATFEAAKVHRALSVERFPDPMLERSELNEATAPRSPDRRLKVIWAGRLLPRKGIELAIRAFAAAQIEADLLILGDGPRMTAAKGLVRALGLESSVEFRGAVSRPEVQAAMALSDVFFFPSLRDSMPAQILEAMGAGLPIVALNAYGNPWLVPEGAGVLVDIESPDLVEALAHALREVSSSLEMRQQMGVQAREASLEHRWEAKVARMTKVYNRAVS